MPGGRAAGKQFTSTGRSMAYGAFPLVALAATLFLEQGERLSLAQALDGIKEDFGVSDTALGGLEAARTVVGALGALPFGWLADRTRRPWLLAGAMLIWTICMGATAVAPGFLMLFIFRLGIGAVEANGPAAVSLLSDYYPVQRRGRVMSMYQMGSALGSGLGLALGGALVDLYSWRAAFAMWVPLGLVVVVMVARLPEPGRGEQDRDFYEDLTGLGDRKTFEGEPIAEIELPDPHRVGTMDYASADTRAVLRELLHIRSMWYAVASITVSQSFLVALMYWGIEFFKRTHDLSASEAGGYSVFVGAGAGVGIFAGGYVADRLLRGGVLNARVYVPAYSSIAATFVLLPALLVDNLLLAGLLFFVAGVAVTLPVAPAEAMMTDVVVAQLRGRAASIRSVVRSLTGLMPAIVGVLSDITSLRTALTLITPLLLIGGVVMLFASRTYGTDLAFVAAEAERTKVAPT